MANVHLINSLWELSELKSRIMNLAGALDGDELYSREEAVIDLLTIAEKIHGMESAEFIALKENTEWQTHV